MAIKQQKIAQRVKNIEVSAIRQMPILAQQYNDTVSLGQGIPAIPTPAYIREGVIELLKSDDNIGKYSLQPGLPELKQEIARRVSRDAGRPVAADEEIIVTVGAMEGLAATIMALVEKGDEVIVFDPSYASYQEQIALAEGQVVPVPLRADDWSLDEKALRSAVTAKTKAIIVCSPSNPTGTVFSRAELAVIAEVAVQNDLIVITDETYSFLTYDEAEFTSLLVFPELKDRLVVCRSFSKEFAMTGWRVGYVYGPAYIIEQVLKVQDAVVICAPTISQQAAIIALTGKPQVNDVKIKEVLTVRRNLICQRLDQLPDLFSYIKPAGAYYILARYLRKIAWDSDKFARTLLAETGVITIPGGVFGSQGEGCIRMSFGGTEEDINEAFDRIEQWDKKI
ncbi:pyridoxal phosphate-dependent aminotransferase [Patescibacteria group bacterium]|nr:pyridoxal phosphate-dependent aminotransferase [Patescibacteria group bacterium]